MKIGLCVPVCKQINDTIPFVYGISIQSCEPNKVLIVNSDLDDRSLKVFNKINAYVYTIKKDDFDHGGTRQLAAELMYDVDIIIFLTQDAILARKTSIENLMLCFSDGTVGAAYGRQLPRRDANPIEAHAQFLIIRNKAQ